jgi:hypothetical protein
VVPDPSGHPRKHIAVSGEHAVDVRVLERDTAGDEAARRMRGERLVELRPPAKLPQEFFAVALSLHEW